MILDYYLIIGMKKDIINNQKQYNHSHHGNTQTIHVCNNVAANRLNIKAAAAAAASSVTAPMSTKNVRSSSLPLKILSSSNSNHFLSNSNSNRNLNQLSASNHVHSWTDFSILNKHRNNFDCFNLNGLYFNYKYRQMSRSDRFLDFIEFREQQTDEQLKFNSNSSISSLSSSSPSTFFSDSYSVKNNSNKFRNNQNKLEEEDEYEFRVDSEPSSSSSSTSSSPTSSPPNENISSNIVNSSNFTSTPNTTTTTINNTITTAPYNSDQIETTFSHSRTFNTNESSPLESLETATNSSQAETKTNEIDFKSSKIDLISKLSTVVDDTDESNEAKTLDEVKTNGNCYFYRVLIID